MITFCYAEFIVAAIMLLLKSQHLPKVSTGSNTQGTALLKSVLVTTTVTAEKKSSICKFTSLLDTRKGIKPEQSLIMKNSQCNEDLSCVRSRQIQ